MNTMCGMDRNCWHAALQCDNEVIKFEGASMDAGFHLLNPLGGDEHPIQNVYSPVHRAHNSPPSSPHPLCSTLMWEQRSASSPVGMI